VASALPKAGPAESTIGLAWNGERSGRLLTFATLDTDRISLVCTTRMPGGFSGTPTGSPLSSWSVRCARPPAPTDVDGYRSTPSPLAGEAAAPILRRVIVQRRNGNGGAWFRSISVLRPDVHLMATSRLVSTTVWPVVNGTKTATGKIHVFSAIGESTV
jgi:hypothetical protein